jgi:hypothetical protein
MQAVHQYIAHHSIGSGWLSQRSWRGKGAAGNC